MKKLAIATALAATSALALPAYAEGTGMKTETQADTSAQSDMQTPSGAQSGDEAAGLSGENLDEEEVRKVQQALKDAGADIEVDGVWGDGTAQALRDYQEEEGLTPSGELDQSTIASLGVTIKESDTQQAEIPEEKPESGMDDEPMMQQPGTDDDAESGTTPQ